MVQNSIESSVELGRMLFRQQQKDGIDHQECISES